MDKYGNPESLIGKKYDIYYTKIDEWWPATIIDADKTRVRIKYLNYKSTYEWVERGSDRVAKFGQHTTKHKIHKSLANEQFERKNEWMSNDKAKQKKEIVCDTIECSYFQKAMTVLNKFVNQNNIDISIFECEGFRCFCKECHTERKDDDTYTRGQPSQIYVLPIGYARFGIKLSKKQSKNEILSKWHVVYHGTKSMYLKEICDSGLILIKPNDFKLNGKGAVHENVIQIQQGHIQEEFERVNAYTKKKEMFNPIQIYTSPSYKYSAMYCDEKTINGYKTSFMFQCRQKPDTYQRGQETMGFYDEAIDEYVGNDGIEFYAKNSLNIAITGLLIKIDD